MMYFLGLFSSNSWLSEGLDSIMGAMEVGIRTLSFSLSTIIYGLIIKLYDVFELLCKGRLLSFGIMKELSTRIGIILGLVMFFYIIFSMVQMLIEPEKINDKEIGAGNTIKKVILVIIMLGFSNFAFNSLYHIQKIVVESHALSNILLPYRIEQDGLDNFGKVLSSELLLSFYQIEDFSNVTLDNESIENYGDCENAVNSFNNQILNSGKFDLGYNCLNESVTVPENTGTDAGIVDREVFIVNYNYIIAPLVGCVAVYMLFMYCFKIGVRMIQLAFLEIISPMAFVSYLAPKKDTMFSKWTKIYVSTYIDVFIRIVIINFVIFLLATIFANTTENGSFTFWETVGGRDSGSALFIKVVIILALLTFAKKAPDLLKDLFGSGAPSKLGFGAAMKDIVGLNKTINTVAGLGAASAVGLIGGVANRKGLGMIAGGLGGALGGALRGAKAGFGAKGIGGAIKAGQQAQSKANVATSQRVASGLGYWESVADKTKGFVGITNSYDIVDKELSTMNSVMSSYENNPVLKKMASITNDTLNKVTMLTSDANLEYDTKLSMFREYEKNKSRISELTSDRDSNSNLSEEERKLILKEVETLENRNSELLNNGAKDENLLAIERDNKIEAANKLYREQKNMEDAMKDATYMIAKANIEAGNETIKATTLRIREQLEGKFKDIVINEDGTASFGVLDVMVTDGNLATMKNASVVLGSEFDKHETFKDANSYRWQKDAEKISVSNKKSS